MTGRDNDFATRIRAELAREEAVPAEVTEAKAALDGAARGIGAFIAEQFDQAQVTVEPGHRTRLGQQYNVVLRLLAQNFRDVMFRAYIPTTGFPVSLDLFGEDVTVCPDRARLEQELLMFTAEQIRPRLRMLVV